MEEQLLGSYPHQPLSSAAAPERAGPWAIAIGLFAVLGLQIAQFSSQSQKTEVPQMTTMLAGHATSKSAVGSAPERFLIDGLTPSAHQMHRGDCYLFSGTGILEDSYRRYGVEKGWFQPDHYLRLSRQALGIAYMEQCKKTPISWCPSNAIPVAGPTGTITTMISWGNNTEGTSGADPRLFAGLSQISDLGNFGSIPEGVCPYTPDASVQGDWKCDGLADARKKNPLQFRVKSWKNHYARDAIKRVLHEDGKPLGLSTTEVWRPYIRPCDARAGCDARAVQCVACPLERVYAGVSCCESINRPMVSMKGEWGHNHGEPLVVDSGHAINIVGYNDHYQTENGEQGGYIVRNTWEDGTGLSHGSRARGSHSAAYYLQSHGDTEESVVCPNPESPRSWATCDDAESCRSPMNIMSAEESRQVMHLECLDLGLPSGSLPKGACEPGDGYFLQNMTEFGTTGLVTACFLRVLQFDEFDLSPKQSSKCYPPMPMDDLPLVFGPTAEEVRRVGVNDPQVCGFNFIPYATYETINAKIGGVMATSFDIEWSERSYASTALAAKHGHIYDYSLIKASTLPLKSSPDSKSYAVKEFSFSQYQANGL